MRKGARLAVLDIDDAWLTIHPSIPAFDQLTQRAAHALPPEDKREVTTLEKEQSRSGGANAHHEPT